MTTPVVGIGASAGGLEPLVPYFRMCRLIRDLHSYLYNISIPSTRVILRKFLPGSVPYRSSRPLTVWRSSQTIYMSYPRTPPARAGTTR
jgi:hypothetical protein